MGAVGLCGKHKEVYSYIDWLMEANDNPILIWWSKRPTGVEVTEKDLRKKIENDGLFYFYYAYGNEIVIRMHIVDFCLNSNSNNRYAPEKLNNWKNEYPNLFFTEENFTEDDKHPKVWFLANKADPLNNKIDELDFGNSQADFSEPTQENLQPVRNCIMTLDERIRYTLEFFKQVILTGPPGTGKTYLAKKISTSLTGKENSEEREHFESLKPHVQIVQFHPSYNYEDFVRGIQVSTDEKGNVQYETKNRILGEIAQQAFTSKENNEVKKFVLIIDEINRANLASVLGELIYALEYRGEKVRTPYSDNKSQEITIPNNLYIIGTMNTADRSVGHIDYAVRRRFAFVPCLPDRSVLESYYAKRNTSYLRDTALELFDSVASLFGGTSTDDNQNNQGYLALDFFKDDVQVGHTYFMADDCEKLAMKYAYQVYPLLREYYKDGILVAGNDGRIDIKVNYGQQSKPISVQPPLKSEEIFDRIVKMCKEREQSSSETPAESENVDK